MNTVVTFCLYDVINKTFVREPGKMVIYVCVDKEDTVEPAHGYSLMRPSLIYIITLSVRQSNIDLSTTLTGRHRCPLTKSLDPVDYNVEQKKTRCAGGIRNQFSLRSASYHYDTGFNVNYTRVMQKVLSLIGFFSSIPGIF